MQSITSFVRSTTLFAEGNLVLCPLIENDVLASLEMMLTASGQTMLCPADTNTKRKHFPKGSVSFWRRHPESDRGIKVLQTSALPLGYGAEKNGADYGARTRHLHLGKVALYQMS